MFTGVCGPTILNSCQNTPKYSIFFRNEQSYLSTEEPWLSWNQPRPRPAPSEGGDVAVAECAGVCPSRRWELLAQIP